jgi:hypothetical protein
LLSRRSCLKKVGGFHTRQATLLGSRFLRWLFYKTPVGPALGIPVLVLAAGLVLLLTIRLGNSTSKSVWPNKWPAP